MEILDHYINNPSIPGYCRVVIEGVCQYIKTEELKRILAEEIQSTKFFKILKEKDNDIKPNGIDVDEGTDG